MIELGGQNTFALISGGNKAANVEDKELVEDVEEGEELKVEEGVEEGFWICLLFRLYLTKLLAKLLFKLFERKETEEEDEEEEAGEELEEVENKEEKSSKRIFI